MNEYTAITEEASMLQVVGPQPWAPEICEEEVKPLGLSSITIASTGRPVDYLTVIYTPRRGNKLISRNKKGIIKKAGGLAWSEAEAMTVPVPDAASMYRLLTEVSEDPQLILMQGYFPGTEDRRTPFRVVSARQMKMDLGLPEDTPSNDPRILGWHDDSIIRCKANTLPSSWQPFDRDSAPGMPAELAELNDEEWINTMGKLLHGLPGKDMVLVRSSTGRVCVDGKPMTASGSHYWYRMEDPSDLARFGKVLLFRSMLAGIGFMRPKFSSEDSTQVVSKVMWSIFDPTTFSHERMVYDGLPTVKGEGLTIAPADITLLGNGGTIDTRALENLSEEELDQAKSLSGERLIFERTRHESLDADGMIKVSELMMPVSVNDQSMQLDSVIETKHRGSMTVRDFWLGEHEHLTCQSTFRESSTWNGILNKFVANGLPTLFDNGSRTRYVLSDDKIEKHAADVIQTRMDSHNNDDILARWFEEVGTMSVVVREKVRQWVHKKTGTGLTVLKAQLNKHLESLERKKKKDAAKNMVSVIRGQGRKEIFWVDGDLPRMVKEAEKAILSHDKPGKIMAMGDVLVHVDIAQPTTVRQIHRLHEQGKEYPHVLMVRRYESYGLRLRIMKSCAFLTFDAHGNQKEIATPSLLVNTILNRSASKAAPLAGIIEHPIVRHDGKILDANGYDQATGYYSNIPRGLIPELPEVITQKMASESLQWMRDEVLADFPFDDDTARDGAVAAFLSAVERRVIYDEAGAPGFLSAAPIQSSGKTALWQLLNGLVFGRTTAAASWPKSGEEAAKLILGILLEGHPSVMFDNLAEGSSLESDELAKAMTSTTYSNRVLGENRTATVPTSVLWLFTGNNVTTEGDFNTRVLRIYLDAHCENPDQRKYSRDLADWAEQNRQLFFYHAFILIAGYLRQGDRLAVTQTRYKAWDHLIREPILWAGGKDVGTLFEENKEMDAKDQERSEMLEAWHTAYGSDWKNLGEMVREIKISGNYGRMSGIAGDGEGDGTPLWDSGLPTILSDMFTNKLNSRSVGKMLAKFVNRQYGEYTLKNNSQMKSKKSKRALEWHVEKKETPTDG